MKIVLWALAVIGFISLTVGIASALQLSQVIIHSSGRIVQLDEEMKSTDSALSSDGDARGFVPIIAGVGLLSTAFLGRVVARKHK